MYIEAIDWPNKLTKDKLIWTYPGHGPHVSFSLNKQHADFYINTDVLNDNETLLSEICFELSNKIKEHISVLPDFVLTYPPFGLKVGQGLAKAFTCQFTALKSLQETSFETALTKNARVLLCADDIISGTSMNKVIKAAQQADVQVIDVLAVIANLSGETHFANSKILSIIEKRVSTWQEDQCKLCATGSLALNARDNWQQLTALAKE